MSEIMIYLLPQKNCHFPPNIFLPFLDKLTTLELFGSSRINPGAGENWPSRKATVKKNKGSWSQLLQTTDPCLKVLTVQGTELHLGQGNLLPHTFKVAYLKYQSRSRRRADTLRFMPQTRVTMLIKKHKIVKIFMFFLFKIQIFGFIICMLCSCIKMSSMISKTAGMYIFIRYKNSWIIVRFIIYIFYGGSLLGTYTQFTNLRKNYPCFAWRALIFLALAETRNNRNK